MKTSQFIVGISVIDNKLFILREKDTGFWYCPMIDATDSREEIRLIHYIRRRIGTDLKIMSRLGDIEITEGKNLKRFSLFDIRLLGGINLNVEGVDLWNYVNRFELDKLDLDLDLKNYILPFCIEKRVLI
ncbi:MAG: hypothetical protein JWP09_722 [Candidatus Taylorbacteria bacterium]|nr:hypothetical protein [Candidatus Taylorbacteria bacterium]